MRLTKRFIKLFRPSQIYTCFQVYTYTSVKKKKNHNICCLQVVRLSKLAKHWAVSMCVCVCVCVCVCARSCLTLCNPLPGWSPPDSSVRVVFPAKNTGVGCHFQLQGSSQHSDWTYISCISCIGWEILYHNTTWEAHVPVYKTILD